MKQNLGFRSSTVICRIGSLEMCGEAVCDVVQDLFHIYIICPFLV